MSRHEGVSCDSCMKANFRGKRYKCLICYDYDLCGTCYEAGATNTRHTPDHAMQCILTRSDFDLYYGGEAVSVEQPQSFTCPICGKMGFTELTLQEHASADHTDASSEVVCPVCAALPGGEPNHVTEDFATHLSLEHRANRDLCVWCCRQCFRASKMGRKCFAPRCTTGNKSCKDKLTLFSATKDEDRLKVWRNVIPYNSLPLEDSDGVMIVQDEPSGSRHVRRIPHPAGRGMSSARARRSQMQFSSTGGLSALSPSNRDSMDPIAELLSQLSSGVRRTATLAAPSTTSQIQQLQMQLQLERQQAQAARQQLERLPRRQAHLASPATLHCPPQAAATTPAPPTSTEAPAAHFLLSRCVEPSLLESEQHALELERADRSLFAQELLLTTLAERLHWGAPWPQQGAPAHSPWGQPGQLSPSHRKVVRVLDERNKLKEH